MTSIFRRATLLMFSFFVAVSALFNILLLDNTAKAAWTPSNPVDSIEEVTKRWFFYRGMRACLSGGLDDKTISKADVNGGQWPVHAKGDSSKKGFGYFAPDMDKSQSGDNDGSVECDDGSIWVRGATAFGFKDSVALLCALDQKLNNDQDTTAGNAITPNGNNCEADSTDFRFKGNYSSSLQRALTATLSDSPKNRPAFRLSDVADSSAMRYLIGKRSLEVFCGNNVLLADGIKNIKNGDNQVSVDIVKVDGSIDKSKVYDLTNKDRDAHSKVDDVIYDLEANGQNNPKTSNNDNNAHDWHCDEMATLTRETSSSFAGYVVSNYNQQLAGYFKGEFKPTEGLDSNVFNKAVDECIDTVRSYAGETAGITEIKKSLGKPQKNEERTKLLKDCLLLKLPKGYNKAIAAIDVAANETTDEQAVNGVEPEAGTSCDIDSVGWIVCPVLSFMANMNDAALSFLGENFLQIGPEFFEHDQTQAAWGGFRDIANILFVIIFLFIIYSQMTGAGISNYGIKRMLPKLIIAAILVNISYILCQVAVDLSNIIGANISQFLATQLPTDTEGGTTYGGLGDLSWYKSVTGALAVAGTAMLAIVLIGSAGFAGLLALAMIVIILVARKAIIILLVVTAPVAFVAYLLPNTEGIFKKWWGLFKAMLLLYPIIGMVFGASILAATIIAETSNGNVLLDITALAVTALLLFAVPFLLKGALGGLGTIGAKLGGGLDRSMNAAKSGGKDRLKRRAENLEAKAAGSNNRYARFAGGFRNRRAFRRKEMESDTARRQEAGLAQHIDMHPDSYTSQQRAAAAATLDKRYEEEVKGSGAALQLRLSHQEMLDAARTGEHKGKKLSAHERDAAVRYTTERGNFDERKALAEQVGSMNRSQRNSLVSGMQAKGDTAIYGNEALAALAASELNADGSEKVGLSEADAKKALREGTQSKIKEGKMSAETLTKDYRIAAHVAAAATSVSTSERKALADDVARFATENPQAWASLDKKTRDSAATI